MAKSKIIITFNDIPLINDTIVFNAFKDVVFAQLYETFVPVRSANKQSTLSYTIQETAYNYYNALFLDNQRGFFTFNYNDNVVEIVAVQDNVEFSISSSTSTSAISLEIINNSVPTHISVNNYEFLQYSPNICSYVRCNIHTSVTAVKYFLNGTEYANSNNPINLVLARDAIFSVTVVDSLSYMDIIGFETPSEIFSADLSVSVFNTPSGASVTVYAGDTQGLTLLYSLDGINWQSENQFHGIALGDYIAYVKDQFTCINSKGFTVDAFSPSIVVKSAFSYLSKAMSIRFKRNQIWDYNDIFKTDENTLSCEENVNQIYKYTQLFKPINLITTQFLSNYSDIEANVVLEDGSRESLPIINKINFLDVKDRRDAKIVRIPSDSIDYNYAGIYYLSGNVYDYTTGDIIDTYALNGNLPSYASVGNYIDISGVGWFLIEDIIYSDVLNVNMIVINYASTISDINIIVGSEFNQKNFNVYEFDIDFSLYNNMNIKVEILQSNEGFEDYNYLSEEIEVRDYFSKTLELIWYNKSDTMVFYSTGIKNLCNVEFTSFDSLNDSSVEIHKTPRTSLIIDSNNYEVKKLLLEDLSTEIMKKITQALLHKELYVNKVQFIANNQPESEVVKFTNLYSIDASLTKTGSVYNSDYPG